MKEFIDIANDVLERNKMKKPGEPKEDATALQSWNWQNGVFSRVLENFERHGRERALGMELVCAFGSIGKNNSSEFAADLKHEMEVKKFEKAIENSKFEPKLNTERHAIQ